MIRINDRVNSQVNQGTGRIPLMYFQKEKAFLGILPTNLIIIHQISKNKLNYLEEHYVEIARKSHVFKEEKISDRVKENLETIGGIYGYE